MIEIILNTCILIILSLSVHKHYIHSHLFRSSLKFSVIILSFSVWRFQICFVKFIHKCFMSFDVIINGICGSQSPN